MFHLKREVCSLKSILNGIPINSFISELKVIPSVSGSLIPPVVIDNTVARTVLMERGRSSQKSSRSKFIETLTYGGSTYSYLMISYNFYLC